jgi:DNA-directed RNA polymerase subunit RPC12/RpoP
MTPTAARLVIGFSLMPVLPGMFFLAGTLINSLLSPGAEWTSFLAYQCSAAILLATWLGIWRSRIEWTPARRLRTLVLATLVVVSPASVFIPDASTLIDMLRDLTPLLMVAVWFAGTALLWRKPDSPRKPAAGTSIELPDDTVRCPKCGYSLNGLREVRCPECGWTSTLDDLVLRSLAFSEDM